ncbi:dienelactone hydrolase family protein [Gammaproteobacteria bacterium]|nr:dienelactone hydrolase family protein [Gammaproteobacteria bacterium]
MGKKTIVSKDGFELGGYEALPDGKPKGGIVVLQEIFGVNKHVREVVDEYAREGYVAIAPQIFDRVERDVELGYTEQPDFDKGLRIAFEDLQMEQTLQDIQASVNAISTHGPVGVLGYCFGGLLTWLSACHLENVTAGSAYYGGGIAGHATLVPKCPMIMHFGEKDAHIPMSDVETIKQAQSDVDVFVYDADHGFNCGDRASYHAESAVLAKRRTLEHFERNLT